MLRITAAEPRAYGDCLGVHAVLDVEEEAALSHAEAELRLDAWIAGSVGYLAGLSAEALRLALEHTLQREAFGRPLAAIEAVQQRLADAATLADGLGLLAHGAPTPAALAHAGEAACAVAAHCHQVVGAIGFTLEFPLQRHSRRARALQLWADAVVEAAT